jgi:hypothetical protein
MRETRHVIRDSKTATHWLDARFARTVLPQRREGAGDSPSFLRPQGKKPQGKKPALHDGQRQTVSAVPERARSRKVAALIRARWVKA